MPILNNSRQRFIQIQCVVNLLHFTSSELFHRGWRWENHRWVKGWHREFLPIFPIFFLFFVFWDSYFLFFVPIFSLKVTRHYDLTLPKLTNSKFLNSNFFSSTFWTNSKWKRKTRELNIVGCFLA